jgi:hypothetical protein
MQMAVDIFGRNPTAGTQRVVSGGVILTQATNAFPRRDGGNAVTPSSYLSSHKIVKIFIPANAQEAATKVMLIMKTSLPSRKLLAPYATNM